MIGGQAELAQEKESSPGKSSPLFTPLSELTWCTATMLNLPKHHLYAQHMVLYARAVYFLSLLRFLICIAPRARRSTVVSLGFVLLLYTFDVQATPIHIVKSWSISPLQMFVLSLHPISTTSQSKRSFISPNCMEACFETDQLPEPGPPCSNLGLIPASGVRASPHASVRGATGRSLFCGLLHADRCPSISCRRNRHVLCHDV